MVVLQLIDTLDVGGAERLAVNLANGLNKNGVTSLICASRRSGPLADDLQAGIYFSCLQKKSRFDIRAIRRLSRLIAENKVDLIHAHGTSFFMATIVKWMRPGLKLVWHEHHGNRVNHPKPGSILSFCSRFFDRIFVVNEELQHWWSAIRTPKIVKVLSNFVQWSDFPENSDSDRKDEIVLLANLRVPKNHLMMLKAFSMLAAQFPKWQLRFIGTDFNDAYAVELKRFVEANHLSGQVLFHGAEAKPFEYLSKAKIGVLSSDSEGLPMSLLEYGAAGLAVVTTKVGACAKVIDGRGILVDAGDATAMSEAIAQLMSDPSLLQTHADDLRNYVYQNHSDEVMIAGLIEQYKFLLE